MKSSNYYKRAIRRSSNANYKTVFFFALYLFFQTVAYGQALLECGGTYNPTSLVTDYQIPQGITSITFTIKGGDGGDAYLKGFGCDRRVKGGSGATVSATFEVGTADNQLQVGGRLKVYVGQKGGTDSKGCAPIPAGVFGSGGGSSAILYLPPGKSPTLVEWYLLAEAGAGGGGARPKAGDFDIGYGGNSGEFGDDVGSSKGGSVIEQRCPITFGVFTLPGIGTHLTCGANQNFNGKRMTTALIANFSDFSLTRISLSDNSLALFSGGTRTGRPSGGDGFNGGGASGEGAGSGAGFGGGAARLNMQGGGGGSFVNSYYKGSNKTKSNGADGAGTESNGSVTLSIGSALVANCQDRTIQLDNNGSASVTAEQINNGSSTCGSLSLSLSKTSFDCSNIGNNTVTLTVGDGLSTTTCTANVMVKDEVAPTARCKNVDLSLDNTGNVTLTAAAVNNGSTDNCGMVSLSIDKTSFDCNSPLSQ
ncbi:MAG: hypothetical protein AAFO07_24465, partial [Bacteroidota bacterium]